MSLMIFHDGVLAADRRSLELGESAVGMKREIQKVHLSPCKRLAFASTGKNIHPKDIPALFALFLDKAQGHKALGYAGAIPFSFEELRFLNLEDRNFFLMTKEVAYVSKEEMEEFQVIDEVRPMLNGSGTYAAVVAIMKGLGAVKAIEHSSRLIRSVSFETDSVKRSQLKILR